MALSLQSAADNDRDFCEQLNRRNMSGYLARRAIEWDWRLFIRSWSEFDNLMILNASVVVGHLRLMPEPFALGLRDLQILPEHQAQGIGTWAIRQAQSIAAQRRLGRLKLRVYEENPAQALYIRLGFMPVSTIDGTVHMTWDVPAN